MTDFATLGIQINTSGASQANSSLRGLQNQAGQTERSIASLEKMVGNLKALLGLGFGVAGINSLIQMADKMKSLNNQIKFVTNSTNEYNQVQRQLFSIAQNTRASFEATATLYTRSARALKDYGYSQQQVLNFTETLNKAMAVGGVGAQEQASALLQLSQALGSGRLQGDEFRSIAETAPIILDTVAEYMGKSRAEVKQLATEGKITSQVLFDAMSGASKKISEQFDTMPLTFGQAMQQLQNTTLKFVSDLDDATGTTQKLAQAVTFAGKNIDSIAIAVAAMGAAFALVKTQDFLKGLAEVGTAKQAQKQATEQATMAEREALQATQQHTAAILQQAQAEVRAAEAEMAGLAYTIQQTVAERELATVRLQGATTQTERLAQMRQIAVLRQQEIILTRQQAAAEQQVTVAREALSAATAQNATAQNAYTASVTRAGIATRRFQGISAGLRNELNILKMAALANPLMTFITVAGTAATAIYSLMSAQSEARKEALRYADSLETVRTSLEKMTATQLKAESVKAGNSIEEQQRTLNNLKREYDEAAKTIAHYQQLLQQGSHSEQDLSSDALYRSRLIKLQREQAIRAADVEQAESKLNQTLELRKQIQIDTETRNEIDALKALMPQLDTTNLNASNLDSTLKSLGITLTDEAVHALKYGGALDSITLNAIKAANALLGLKTAQSGISEKAQQIIDRNSKQGEIAKLQKAGDTKGANKIRAELAVGGMELDETSRKAVQESYENLYNLQESFKTGNGKLGSGSAKSAENARQNWLSFYDDIRKQSSSSLAEINLEQGRMFQRLEEHLKKGVVSHQEYETAKTAITERFAKQRLELAGKYAPEKLLKSQLEENLKAIQELQQAGELSLPEAQKATQRVQIDYAQQQSQNAVDPLAQMRAKYDPNQEILNQQTQELAQLQAFYDQKLMAEDEFQQHRSEIIANYQNQQQQRELDYYSQSAQTMASAFDTMASVAENYGGKQSGMYKAMFAVSKAFAIADSIIKIQQGIANAAAQPYPANLAAMASVAAATANIISTIQSVSMSFATGGYTGDGGKYDPAGVVHKGEYVITKEATARLGKNYLDYLNYGKRGFANGGGVGVPTLPNSNYSGVGNGNRVSVQIINNGEPVSASVRSEQNGDQLEITVELMKQMDKIADQRYRRNQQNDMRSGGMMNH
ncbi:tape measure protein [Lonepinella sp. BR2930]|uniref:tape measure protein n=1 Tax=Lonepinella sp. BR2930 TaxID=3434554 RepID=UPI003F6E1C10